MLDFLEIDPVAFTIPIGGGFDIFWYGIIVTLGIAVGAWWAGREINRRGGDPDELYNGLLIVVIAGYAFARGWYVLQDIFAGAQYDSLLDVVNIRAGGANILGGFAGAALVAFLYLRWRKLDYWNYADVAGPALLIAQAIGRWGNLINQELYGPPTDAPWGILISANNRIAPYGDLATYPLETRFHPTFLYESILLLLGFIVLVWLNSKFRDSWKKGTLFGAFMMWWGVGRFIVEFFRPDQPSFGDGPITYSMVISLGFAIVGLILVLDRFGKLPESPSAQRRRRRRVRKPKPQRSSETE
jgi:phosphatidylglycerol:prolipoprotein diacylglycerol transferase